MRIFEGKNPTLHPVVMTSSTTKENISLIKLEVTRGHVCVAQHVYLIAMKTNSLKGNPQANTALVSSEHIAKLRGSVMNVLREYSEVATVHGIGYVFSRSLPSVDRLLWTLSTITW